MRRRGDPDRLFAYVERGTSASDRALSHVPYPCFHFTANGTFLLTVEHHIKASATGYIHIITRGDHRRYRNKSHSSQQSIAGSMIGILRGRSALGGDVTFPMLEIVY